jgi:hypothetical protein
MLHKKKNREEPDEIKEEPEVDYNCYGEEDLYYKEEKISEQELKDINDQVRDYRIKLLKYVENKETVQKTIQRLKPKSKNDENKKKFDELLDIISKLTELSYFDVYTDTIDKIKSKYKFDEVDANKYKELKWKYRMITSKAIKEFGPFTTDQIQEWFNKVIKYLS